MDYQDDDLEVYVEAISIIVTDPKTKFMAVYQKQFAKPSLVLTCSSVEKNETSAAAAGFHARARLAALAKARDWGWID